MECPSPPAPESSANWRDGLGALTYDTRTNRITTPGFAYDAAGNQIRSLGGDGRVQQYQYDAAGRLAKVLDENGNLVEAYSYYDTSNLRLSTQPGDAATYPRYYIWSGTSVIAEYEDVPRGGPVVPESGGGEIVLTPESTNLDWPEFLRQKSDLHWDRSYIYLGERLLATIEPDASSADEVMQFHHPDRLSTRLITNAADNDVLRQETFPFGIEVPGSSSEGSGQKFTSYDRSAGTGLDYAVNRYYDPEQGRFIQVDPFEMGAMNLIDPQGWNMFAYVQNDAANEVDPMGLLPANAQECWLYSDGGWSCILDDGTFVAEGPEVVVEGTPLDSETRIDEWIPMPSGNAKIDDSNDSVENSLPINVDYITFETNMQLACGTGSFLWSIDRRGKHYFGGGTGLSVGAGLPVTIGIKAGVLRPTPGVSRPATYSDVVDVVSGHSLSIGGSGMFAGAGLSYSPGADFWALEPGASFGSLGGLGASYSYSISPTDFLTNLYYAMKTYYYGPSWPSHSCNLP